MLKKLSRILDKIMALFVGAFIGHGIFVLWDYRAHPGLYAMQPAPWYTSILSYGAVTAGVLLAAVLIKLIIRRKIKQQSVRDDRAGDEN